jgi:hypothetical protein
MEPSESQFAKDQKVFRKGDNTGILLSRAVEQAGQRNAELKKIGPVAQETKDKARGITGAENVVSTKVTLEEANRNPDAFGGPVSGAHMDKLERRNARTKKERSDAIAKARKNLKRY